MKLNLTSFEVQRYPRDRGSQEPLVEAGRRFAAGETFCLLTVVDSRGSTPRGIGSKMLLLPDGTIIGSIGGGSVEKQAADLGLETMQSGQIIKKWFNLEDPGGEDVGSVCGGELEVMIEPFGVGARLFLFGAGHVALPTARLAREVGFRVTVLDGRHDLATPERFPGIQLIVKDTETAGKELAPSAEDYIAIMTPSHDEDFRIVRHLLAKPFRYLGMIGSKKKAAFVKKNLANDGFTTKQIARMNCPIGLEIGSHTPEEIAVSVVAQLLQVRNLGTTSV